MNVPTLVLVATASCVGICQTSLPSQKHKNLLLGVQRLGWAAMGGSLLNRMLNQLLVPLL